MKSKRKSTSFFLELLGTQKWLMLVTALISIIVYPVPFMMTLESYDNQYYSETITQYIKSYFLWNGSDAGFYRFSNLGYTTLYISIVVGVVFGVIAFSYLHNRAQVGLYHSLPIKRERLLHVKLGVATITYFLPLFGANLMILLVASIREVLSGEFIMKLMILLGYNVLMFWMGYFVAAIAMLLTGRVIVGILGSAVFMFYAPAVTTIVNVMISQSFQTFVSVESGFGFVTFNRLYRVSPILYLRMVEWNAIKYLLLTIGINITLWAIHLWLMKKRPSEAAGKAMAYHLAGEIIKVMIVVVISIGSGLLFLSISYGSNTWLYFGTVFGLIVGYIVMQLFYGIDFRSLFKQKIQLLILFITMLTVVISFDYDLFGYDSYIPDYSEISDINIEIDELNNYGLEILKYGEYDAHMDVNEETYALMEHIIEQSMLAYEDTSINHKEYTSIYVEYKLNNGRIVRREYNPYLVDVVEEIKILWENEEYLNIIHPIRVMDLTTIDNIEMKYSYESVQNAEFTQTLFNGDTVKQQQFATYYQEDMLEITAADIINEQPLAIVSIRYNQTPGTSWDYNWYECAIYPSCLRSIAYLESEGVILRDSWGVEEVQSIDIRDYSSVDNIVTSTDEIEEIFPTMIQESLTNIFCETDDSKYAYVELEGGDYREYGYSARFLFLK
ncbi:MAG: DUF6449 domain-containing protein [Eubacteriales bacterium]